MGKATAAGRLRGGGGLVCGDQSGRTSAPMSPHLVQTMRGRSDRTTVSSGSQSALSLVPWLHWMESQ